MLSWIKFKEERLKIFNPFKDKPDGYAVLLAQYAEHIMANLDGGCYKLHCGIGNEDDVSLNEMVIEVGGFSAEYCCDLLDVDKIFVAEHEDFDYLLVGEDGEVGEYNKLGSYVWCGFYGEETLVYGDILIIRKGMFVE